MKLTGQKGRPLLAAILSGLFPGIGQLYNRQFRKGALFVTAGIVAGFGPFSPAAAHLDLDNPTVALEKTLITSSAAASRATASTRPWSTPTGWRRRSSLRD